MGEIDLSKYTLFPATPEQIIEYRTRGHAQWGSGLPLERYLNGYARLAAFEHAANGRLETWVLAPVSDPQTLDFLCSCETYRREGFVVYPGETVAKEETMFGIGAVYTPPKHRRKGAARRMMRLLHRVLAVPESLPPFPAAWGTPPTVFPPDHKFGVASVLYSDVGAEFYSQCGPSEDTRGWKLDSPVGTVWEVSKVLEVFAASGAPDKPITILGKEDLEPIWAEDSERMRVERLPSASTTATMTFAPWRGVGGVQVLRTEYLLKLFDKTLKEWGARIPAEGDELTYATWMVELQKELKTLIFTRIRSQSSDNFRTVLHAAVQVAANTGLRFVEAWNLPEHLMSVAEEFGGKTEARTGHLNCIAWYGPGDNVSWSNNEKFAWC